MSGYSFIPNITPNINLNFVYVGAVKNGNKLTLALAGKITKQSDFVGEGVVLGNFIVPLEVGKKIYPIVYSGATNHVDNRMLSLFSTPNTSISCPARIIKYSTSTMQPVIVVSSLTANTEYVFRYEITFLLSDNLAS